MRQRVIKDIFTIIYKGLQMVGFKADGLDKYIYLGPGNVKQCTGISINEVELLIGSKIRPEFYKEGDKMLNGKICERGNNIIMNFWIECAVTITEIRNQNKKDLYGTF